MRTKKTLSIVGGKNKENNHLTIAAEQGVNSSEIKYLLELGALFGDNLQFQSKENELFISQKLIAFETSYLYVIEGKPVGQFESYSTKSYKKALRRTYKILILFCILPK